MAKQIQVERDGPIATVTLSRPRKLNALTRSMWHKLGEAIVTLSADNDVRVGCPHGCGQTFHSGCHKARLAVYRGDSRFCAVCSRRVA